MLERLLRAAVKVAVASLIVGAILGHFGITIEMVMKELGLSTERIADIIRQGLAWALPNMLLGAFIILPVWFVIFLFRPPGRSSD